MTTPPAPTPRIAKGTGGPSVAARVLAVLIFLVSAGGLAAHVLLYVLGPDETIGAFVHGAGARVSAGLAFLALLAGHIHYWRTRMRLDIASRVLAYLWILSIILLLHRVMRGFSLLG
ncbi:MAG: hypothetical protein WBD63_00570 [Phycisphaerae bacterium]|nr:hypothetical protein [Phycisphaerae bacterium]